MPARIVLVFDEQEFVEKAFVAFQIAGLDCIAFTNPTRAMEALEHATKVELLITRAEFPGGVQTGVSLALTTKLRRPDVKILFIAKPIYEEIAREAGHAFIPLPVTTVQLIEAAKSMLSADAA